MKYIIAPNYRWAARYADDQQWSPREWRYVREARDLRGVRLSSPDDLVDLGGGPPELNHEVSRLLALYEMGA